MSSLNKSRLNSLHNLWKLGSIFRQRYMTDREVTLGYIVE
jgi:hypothetical protein